MKPERITRFFVNNPVLFWSMMAIIVIGGIISYIRMPKLEDPAVAAKQASVVLVWPGASAHDMELKAVRVLEDQLRALPDVDEIRSECRPGMATITVEFKMTVLNEDLEQHFDLLRRKAADSRQLLPSQVYDPIVVDDMMDTYGLFYALTGEDFTYPELEEYAKLIRRRLLAVDGVKRVIISGARPEVIDISIDKDKLAGNGMIPMQIMTALQGAAASVDGGKIDADGYRYNVRVSDRLENEDDLAALEIKTPDDRIVRLGDIADIRRTFTEPQTNGFFVSGKPAIAISLALEDGVVVPDVGKDVDIAMDKLTREELPVGLTTEKIFFQPDKVNDALGSFLLNLLESVVIVIVVLMFTMGLRSGIIIGLGLVLTIALSFPILLMMDSTLQRISLGAFIIGMGMLVDNAIVIMDGILIDRRRGLKGDSYLYRIGNSTAMPLLGATIIAVATFLSVYLSPDSAGEYCRDLFLVLLVALLGSWVLALVQVPVCARLWLPAEDKDKGGQTYNSAMHRAIRRIVATLIRHRKLSIGCAIALLALSIYGMQFVKNLFFPDFDYNQFVIEMQMPAQTSPDVVRGNLMDITERLESNPKVERVAAAMGVAPSHYCLVRPITNGGDSYGELIVDCKDFKTVNELIEEIRDSLRADYPDAYIRFRHYNFSIATSHPVEVQFRGPDPAVLRQLADSAMTIMRACEYVDPYSVSSNWENPGKSYVAVYDRASGLRAGLERENIADAILAATDGKPVGVIDDGDKKTIVNLRVRNNDGNPIGSIDDAPAWTMANVSINSDKAAGLLTGASSPDEIIDFSTRPVSAVADSMTMMWEEQFVYRVNGERAIEAQCDPDTRKFHGTVAKVNAEIKDAIEAIKLPPGYSLYWMGEDKMSGKAMKNVIGTVPVTIFIILTVLLMLFRSWKGLILVLSCLPFVMCGIVIALLGFRQPFTFMAIVGLLGLMGMMIKNSIVLIDEINRNRTEEGQDTFDAIINATVSRTRPVIMASLTTILGMAPLLGDPMYGSMAICIMSGLAVGTCITLLLLPVLYSAIYRVKAK